MSNNLYSSIAVVIIVILNIAAILFFILCLLIYKKYKSKKFYKKGASIFIKNGKSWKPIIDHTNRHSKNFRKGSNYGTKSIRK